MCMLSIWKAARPCLLCFLFSFQFDFPGEKPQTSCACVQQTENTMSNSMLGSLAGRRQGVGSALRGCAYARQLADPLTSAREKLKSNRELLEKCSKEVGLMNSMGTGLGTSLFMHSALCTGLRIRTVCLLKSQPQTA